MKHSYNFYVKNAPNSDPWRNQPFVSFPSEKEKSESIQKSCVQDLNKNDVGKRFVIVCLNFSQVLLTKFPGCPNTLLDRSEVRKLDEDEQVFHRSYEAQKFCLHALVKTIVEAHKDLFVKAPLVPKDFIAEEIKSLQESTGAL